MANWKETVDFSDLWADYENSRIEADELAIKIGDRLSTTALFKHSEQFRDVVIELVDEATLANNFDIDSFDAYLQDIYNLADINHSLWIRTF